MNPYRKLDLHPKTMPLAVLYALAEMQIGPGARTLIPHFEVRRGLMLISQARADLKL